MPPILYFNIIRMFLSINSIILFQYYNFKNIAHNVPAVYDVLPARIRACAARPGLAKCAGMSRESVAT
jgi:hypothetical protein